MSDLQTTPAPTNNQSAAAEGGHGFRWHHRLFVAGHTGGGKSELINLYATRVRCQRLLYDTKDEWHIPGVEPVHSVKAIDWKQPIIHLVDDSGDLDETDRLFRAAWARKPPRLTAQRNGLVIIVHELGDVCGDRPNSTPTSFVNYVKKGDAHGLGLLAGTQRPVNVPKIARTQAEHVVSMCRGFDAADVDEMAAVHNLSVREYEHALAQARELGEYSYVYRNRLLPPGQQNVVRPQLPEQLLRRKFAVNIASTRRSGNPEHSGDEGAPEPDPERSGVDSGASTSTRA